MLPYAGTPIERRLREEGRLKGSLQQPDYELLDPDLDWYAFFVQQIFMQRNFSGDGLQVALQEANFNERLNRAVSKNDPTVNLRTSLNELIRAANSVALVTLEKLLDAVERDGVESLLSDQSHLLTLCESEWKEEARIEIELLRLDRDGEGNRLGLEKMLAHKHGREAEVIKETKARHAVPA
jgi:hypothetical protein